MQVRCLGRERESTSCAKAEKLKLTSIHGQEPRDGIQLQTRKVVTRRGEQWGIRIIRFDEVTVQNTYVWNESYAIQMVTELWVVKRDQMGKFGKILCNS